MSNLTTLGKTAQTYARDLADMFRVSFWQGVGTAGIAAAGSLVKGVLARVVGDKNSASTAPGV